MFCVKTNSAIFRGKKETSRNSPSSLLSLSCCCQDSLWMWPSPVQILCGLFQSESWARGFQGGAAAARWLAGFLGYLCMGKGVLGLEGFCRLQASRRPCGHVNVAALGPCLHPSVLTSVGLLSLLLEVFCTWGPEQVF